MAKKTTDKMTMLTDQLIHQIMEDRNPSTQEDLFGPDGVIKHISGKFMEYLLEKELENELGYEKHSIEGNNSGNSRNGTTPKTVKTGNGDVPINVPRDRNGEFEPQLIKKHESRLQVLDEQILALYAKGMTVRDIQSFIEELYGTSVSRDLVSRITDGINEEMTTWLKRSLDPVYPIVYIDGFSSKCRLSGQVANRTTYIVFGITMEGLKDVLGIYVGENEGAKYWLSVLTELKNRGLEDVFLMCADGLKGLPEAIQSAFPESIFQTCLVHMVRYSMKFVPYQDRKAVCSDLRNIYQSDTVELAEIQMDEFEKNWGEKYPAIVRSWRKNWENIIPFFDYPQEIRRIIYTTNIIESLNNTFRKAVRNRGHFPTEEALLKVMYLSIQGVQKKWNKPIKNWRQALNQFSIFFSDRFPEKL